MIAFASLSLVKRLLFASMMMMPLIDFPVLGKEVALCLDDDDAVD